MRPPRPVNRTWDLVDGNAMQDPQGDPARQPAPPARATHLRVVHAKLAGESPQRKKPARRVSASKDPDAFFDQPMGHSLVKATILSKYFKSWAGIIKTRTRDGKLAYLDLFAGKGRYDDGTPSTPVLIMETIIGDPLLREKTVTFFADESADCVEALRTNINALPGINALKHQPQIKVTTAKDSGFADYFQTASVVPSFMFLDPFGYDGVTIKLIRAILKDWGCDVACFFCFRRMPSAIMNDKVRGHMDDLFGHERVENLRRELPTLITMADKERVILHALEESVKEIGGRFLETFRFRDTRGVVTHHIVFVTKDPTAHKIMKDIMAAASSGETDGVKNFEFTTAPQLELSTHSPIEELMATC